MATKQPRTLEDFGKLTRAEQQVLDELDTGEVIELGDGKVPPEDAGPERQLRARFVRWLVLGGDDDHRLHEKGLRVRGALITSDGPVGAETRGLDLAGCEIAHNLGLFFCRFADPPLLRSARLQDLFLNGSVLPGLGADRLQTRGGVFLGGAEVKGEVRLPGARIDGDLSCDGAKITSEGGTALNADRLETRGGVYLRGAEVTGEIRLLGARIGGDLSCTGAKIANSGGKTLNAANAKVTGNLFLTGIKVTGEVCLVGARIGGNLECDGAKITNSGSKALNAEGAKVTGSFFLRAGAKIDGELDLTAAELGNINDDPACWPEKTGDLKITGDLVLDRCRYGAFTGHGISAAERIRWLALQDPARFGKDFWPQPYEQCAKVFSKMGHLADAKEILIEKEKLQRAARRAKLKGPRLWWFGFWDRFLAATVRYGQKPLFALWWLLGLWLFGMYIFYGAWQAEAFKPNNASILHSAEWFGCAQTAPPGMYRGSPNNTSQLDCFLEQSEAEGFPTFNAAVYAFDVLIPLVNVEQRVHWVPDEDIRPIGRFAKGVFYFEIVAGWLLSLLVVAGLSGIIKSD